MTNENELEEMREKLQLQSDVCNLLKSRKERIDALESAIREFLKADKATDHAEDGCALGDINIDYFERKWKAEETLRNLMENKS